MVSPCDALRRGTDSCATAERCGPDIAYREIDRVRVLGREAPVILYQPLGLVDDLSQQRREADARFAGSLEAFRAGAFEVAARGFDSLANTDPVAIRMASRARELVSNSPPAGWDGVRDLEMK